MGQLLQEDDCFLNAEYEFTVLGMRTQHPNSAQFIYAALNKESCECLREPPEVKQYATDYWRSNLIIFVTILAVQALMFGCGWLRQMQHMQEVIPTSEGDNLVEMHLKEYLETADA